jgi:diguanylate cyclase (GGDEF)-like protein
MTRPGFRRRRPGGAKAQTAAEQGDGFLSSSLFSQAQILHLMKNEFARGRRHGVPLGCALLQIDRIHPLVDLHGAGLRNAARQALAQLVRDKTRGADMLGATNDDRYLLILPHTTLDQTRVVAERLHDLFAELEITVDGRELALTLSVGITACQDQSTLFFDTFVGQAETALEYAIANGGDHVASFGEAQLGSGGTGASDPGDRSAPGGAAPGRPAGGEPRA